MKFWRLAYRDWGKAWSFEDKPKEIAGKRDVLKIYISV